MHFTLAMPLPTSWLPVRSFLARFLHRTMWRLVALETLSSYRTRALHIHLSSQSLALFTLTYLLLSCFCPQSHSYLIFATRKDIRRLEENPFQPSRQPNISVITNHLEEAITIDFDYENRLLFYGDIGIEAIRGYRLSDGQTFDIITTSIASPDGIACDWITKKIYWTDSDRHRIEVSNYNGSYRSLLFWTNLDQPRAIVLVPAEGLLFWSDWGDEPKIERASMDGNKTSRKVIINKNIFWPNGLTVDYPARRLYWVDAKLGLIFSSDYDGANPKQLSCGAIFHPFALTLHRKLLYWTDWKTCGIHICNQSSGTSTQFNISSANCSGKVLEKPMGISVFDQSRQPKSSSPCLINNGNCSHLCLLSSVSPDYYSCGCPIGIKLMEDGKTCLPSPEKILLVARRSDIRKISLDTTDYTPIILPIRGIKDAMALDYDPVEERVYWTDNDLRVIKRAYLNGSNQETIISTELPNPDGIAIDSVGRNIFFIDSGTGRIEVAHLNGSSRTILINEGLDKPRAIVLHPQGLLFWSDWGEMPKIERAAFDGSNRITLVNTSITWPNGLAIDEELSAIFWCDAKKDTIEMVLFDGSGRKMIWSNPKLHLFGFTILEEWIYWSDWQHRTVERIHKLTGGNRELLVDQLPDLMGIKAISVKERKSSAIQQEVSPCAANNGGCSHLCLNRPRSDYVCACPTGHKLSVDQTTCIISEAYLLVLRKTDIRKVEFSTSKEPDSVVMLAGLDSAIGFDVNVANNSVFWVESKQKAIFRSNILHFSPNLIVQLTVEAPQSVIIDWISNNLYWISPYQMRIEVSRSDGSFRRIIFSDTKLMPHSLAIDPIAGYLFFSLNDFSKGRIDKSSLDGGKRETIVESTGKVTSLTPDYAHQKLYWIADSKTIMFCSYNGSSQIILLQEGQSRLSSLALFRDMLFVLDSFHLTIQSINKSDPSIRAEVWKSELLANATDLFMQHPLKQRGWNFCAVNNGDCEHLCFLDPHFGSLNALSGRDSPAKFKNFRQAVEPSNMHCSCATHYRLDSEQKCLPPESFLLFTHRNEFTRFLFDSENAKNNFQDVTHSASSTKLIKALTYDQYEHCVYLLDGKNSIKRILLNGSRAEEVITSSDNEIFDLVIDPYSRMLFWTSTNKINATRLVGHLTSIGVIHQAKGDFPRLLTYHYQQNYLFWTNDLQSSQIERISMVTGSRQTVISNMLGQVLSLTVDQNLGYIFWACKSSSIIEYSNLDGNTRATLYYEPDIHPIALAAHSKFLFWIEKDKKALVKVSIDLNKGRNKQTIFSRSYPLTDIISVTPLKSSSSLPCANTNDNCSHICVMIHSDNTTKCTCPKGLVLSNDGKNCTEPIRCEQNKFGCNDGIHCIDAILLCNGSPDCPDDSDEFNCPVCGRTKFSCHRNIIEHDFVCLDEKLICDNRTDCVGGYDEMCCDKETEFHCFNHHCISTHQLCDGKKDCGPRGEDEDPANCRRRRPHKTPIESHHTFTYSLLMIVAFVIIFLLFLCFQCRRCFMHREKEGTDILMTEQSNPLTAISLSIRNTQHRTKLSYNKKFSVTNRARTEICNTLTSTTTISALDTLPTESHDRHVPFEGIDATMDTQPSLFPSYQTESLIAPHIVVPSSSNSSDPASYPYETINPPPSPVTERSQSVYSSHSSSLFVPRSRNRNKNGVFSVSKPNVSTRRPKKSRWHKRALRGPPPTPCGTDVYEDFDMEPSTVKYIFYDNSQTEMDDLDYKPPPPTPRNYFSDASCPPSPVTERSFCNNINPPPPSPVQESD